MTLYLHVTQTCDFSAIYIFESKPILIQTMAAKRPRTDEFIPQKEMSAMLEMLDNYPTAPSLESLQREINELKMKLDQVPPETSKPKARKVTLASVDNKLDYLISLLTNGANGV